MDDKRIDILKKFLERGLIKRKGILDKLNKAKEKGETWKVNQLQNRLDILDKKKTPTIIWDSSKGTFKRTKIILETLSAHKLKDLAKKHNIQGYSKMTKVVLIEELRKKGV